VSQQQLEGIAASIRQLAKNHNDQRTQIGGLLEAFNRRLAQVEKALGIVPAPMLPASAPAVVAAAPRATGAPPAPAPIKVRPGSPVVRPVVSRGTTPNGLPPPAPPSTPGQSTPGLPTATELQNLIGGIVQSALASLLQAPMVAPAAAGAAEVLETHAEPVDGTLQGTPHPVSADDTSWLHEEGGPVPPIVTEVQTASVSHPR
jgi:hypothetical protein